jgi:hypothetical protein
MAIPKLYVKNGKKYKLVYDSNVGFPYRDANLNNVIILSDRMSLAPGLWLSQVTPGCKSLTCLSNLTDIPSDPYNFTKIIMRRDELAAFITKYHQQYSKNNPHPNPDARWLPSNSELVEAILNELFKRTDITMGKYKLSIDERRLDPEL